MTGIAQIIELIEASKTFKTESIFINFETTRTDDAPARVEEGVGVGNDSAIGATELSPFCFRAAGRAGTVDAAGLRALYALSVVHRIAVHAGIATVDAGALAVGQTRLAVLQIEEVACWTSIKGSVCERRADKSESKQDEGKHYYEFINFSAN